MGFDVTDIVDCGEFYVVEGDIMIVKADLPGYNVGTRHRRVFELVGNDKVRNIKVGVDMATVPSYLSANMENAVRESLAAWSGIPDCAINMTYTTQANPDILIKFLNFRESLPSLPYEAIGHASSPSNGNPGSGVRLNTNHYFTYDQLVFVIIHELGHTLGFHHSDMTSGYYIPGTPDPAVTGTYDYGSVMRSVSGYSFLGFTAYDMFASRYLYPLYPQFTISVSPQKGAITPGKYIFRVIEHAYSSCATSVSMYIEPIGDDPGPLPAISPVVDYRGELMKGMFDIEFYSTNIGQQFRVVAKLDNVAEDITVAEYAVDNIESSIKIVWENGPAFGELCVFYIEIDGEIADYRDYSFSFDTTNFAAPIAPLGNSRMGVGIESPFWFSVTLPDRYDYLYYHFPEA